MGLGSFFRKIDDQVRGVASDADDWRRDNPVLSAMIPFTPENSALMGAGGALLGGGMALGGLGAGGAAAGGAAAGAGAAAATLWMGIYPESFIAPMRADVGSLLARVADSTPASDAQLQMGKPKAAAHGEAH